MKIIEVNDCSECHGNGVKNRYYSKEGKEVDDTLSFADLVRKIILLLFCSLGMHIKREIILDKNKLEILSCPICGKYLDNEFKWRSFQNENNKKNKTKNSRRKIK